MKNNLLTLLKYKIINDFKLNKTKNNQKATGDTIRKRLGLYVLIGAVIVFYAWLYFEQFYADFKPVGLEQYILPIFMIITSLLVFVYSIRLTENVLFKSNDYEMLAALPIQPRTILSSKLIYILGINYFFSFLIMLTASIMFVNAEGLGIGYILLNVLFSFVIPIIPIVLGALISIAVGWIATKFKYTNFVTTVLIVFFLLAFLFMPTTIQDGAFASLPPSQIDTMLMQIYYPGYMFKEAILDMNILNILLYLAINILVFVGFVYLVGKLYKYINQKLNEKFKASKFKGKQYKTNNQFGAMLHKELKKIFTTPIYLMNACFGLFILLGLSVFVFVTSDTGITQILNVPEVLPYRDSIIIVVLSIICAMSSTTGSSVSLEGKNLWIYKSMPVDIKQVLKSKICANLVIALPVIVIAATLISFKFNLSLGVYVLCMFLPLLFLIATALFGLLVNLKYPVFDFENEVYVVKRSLSSMLSVMVPMAVSLLLVVLPVALPINNIMGYLALSLLLCIINILMYTMVLTWGVKRFAKLD